MPSEKILEGKKIVVADLKAKLDAAVSCVVFDYKGITVAQDTKLRKEMREAGVEYMVVKNTLLAIAAKQAGYEGLIPSLNGTTSVAISSSDYTAGAKILAKLEADSKGKFAIKAGFADNDVLDADGVRELAKLPPREVLIAKMLGSMNAPISGFVRVLNGNLTGLVVALNAIAEKQTA